MTDADAEQRLTQQFHTPGLRRAAQGIFRARRADGYDVEAAYAVTAEIIAQEWEVSPHGLHLQSES